MFQIATPAAAASAFANVPAVPSTFPPLPAATPAPAAPTGTDGSIVNYLNGLGQASDIGSRTTLAGQYGITGYTGSAAQNTALLTALVAHKAGATPAQAGSLGAAAGAGQTNPLGLPSNLNQTFGNGTQTGNTPIDLSALSKNPDIAPLLATGALSDLSSSQIAGLSSVLDASKTASDKYDKLGTDLTTAMTSLGGEAGDLQTALTAAGVPQAQKQINDLSVTAAQLKGQLDAFDAETQTGLSGLENQQIPTGLIQGQQAAYQKQRDLSRLSMSAQLSAEAALLTAYQGNLDSATKLATQAVDTKYKAIGSQIQVLQTQLGLSRDNMSAAEKKQSDVVNALLDVQKQKLTLEQTNQKQIQTLAVTAASNGAPLSVVRAIQNASDPVSAATAGASYVGSVSGQGTQDGGGSTKNFSTTQINNGASLAGLTIDAFKQLNSDVQNWYINGTLVGPDGTSENAGKAFNSYLSAIENGTQDPAELTTEITSSTLPDAVKTYLTTQIKNTAPSGGSKGGGFLSGVGDFFNGALNFLGL